jgi:hypothetical protein
LPEEEEEEEEEDISMEAMGLSEEFVFSDTDIQYTV